LEQVMDGVMPTSVDALKAGMSVSAPPKRPRGRPAGSKAQVIRDARALGIHHFAFVRSSLWGLNLAHSFER
jgi:hypothetical protein